MKGVSTVIATLLMLIITIALAGVAYTFITQNLRARTAIVISIEDSFCDRAANQTFIYIRNSGTEDARDVNVTVRNVGSVLVDIPAGQIAEAVIDNYVSGSHTIIVRWPQGVQRSTVVCQ